MSEHEDNVVSLDAHRADAMNAAYERGEVFRFEHLHFDEFHIGTTEAGQVVMNRKETNDGFAMTVDDARRFAVEILECCGVVEYERLAKANGGDDE